MFFDNYIFIIALSLILKAIRAVMKQRSKNRQSKETRTDSVFKVKARFELTIER